MVWKSNLSPEQKRERIDRAVRLRSEGYTYAQIAEIMRVSLASVHRYITQSLQDSEPSETFSSKRVFNKAHLQMEQIQERIEELLNVDHWMVQHGRVVYDLIRDKDGKPITVNGEHVKAPVRDREMTLKTAKLLLQYNESMRKLHGVNREQETTVPKTVTIKLSKEDEDL